MSGDTLAYGLVQVTTRSGVENARVLREVKGTYVEGYSCPECRRTFTEHKAQSGHAYRCENCEVEQERETYQDPATCDNCTDCEHDCYRNPDCENGCDHSCSDDDCPAKEMERLNDRYGFAADLICPSCYAQPLEVTDEEAFVCDECDETVNSDDVEQHLYEHLENAWI